MLLFFTLHGWKEKWRWNRQTNANYKLIGGTLHTFRLHRARGTLNHEFLSVLSAECMTYYDKLTWSSLLRQVNGSKVTSKSSWRKFGSHVAGRSCCIWKRARIVSNSCACACASEVIFRDRKENGIWEIARFWVKVHFSRRSFGQKSIPKIGFANGTRLTAILHTECDSC